MNLDPIGTKQELAARIHWTLARLGETINDARAVGWAQGDAIPDVDDSGEVLHSMEPDALVATPMRLLAARLGLSAIEMDVLWLLACVELDPALSCAARHLIANGMNELSAQIVERLVVRDEGIDDAVFENLQRLALIETNLDPRLPLYRRPVRVHDRVLQLARSGLALDRSLAKVARLVTAIEVRRDAAKFEIDMPVQLQRAVAASGPSMIVATGVAGSGRATLLRHAVSSCGRAVIDIRCAQLASDNEALIRQLRSIARECRLHDAWPLLLDADSLGERLSIVEDELLGSIDGLVFATTHEPYAAPTRRTVLSIAVDLPGFPAREAMWRRALPGAKGDVIRDIAAKYTIPPSMIAHAATTVMSVASEPSTIEPEHIHRALRAQLERQLVGIARRVETRQTWNDLVLPIDQFDLLIEMVARVRHRQRVLDDWGFAAKVGRGLGLSALMSGPPGTGKTMVAGLIAQELGLDLYQVDLSKVVSKYIGETEKQLSALFEAAESGHAIVLFDEADSLFAKRTEVKSSNDRYANLEVNYLLQRIEAFSGITLLTTNHETAIDQAFMRRLAFHVRVPMPEERQREQLWQSMLPAQAERSDDLDFANLASEFVMSGGYIKNAVLRAAFLSAEEGSPITNDHLWRAARAEYEAMGKVAFQPGGRLTAF